MSSTSKITETIIFEVTGVKQESYYPEGYAKPAKQLTMLKISANPQLNAGLRGGELALPGNLPLGTRFKVTLEQIDDVESATITRGALPNIVDRKLIEGEVQ